ncbi:PEP-CTERM sorting domain-containing protein [Thalassotalea agarivorans]|uniref:PEP-CTERM protein-sorting domain-containing protein n=1 Tax=Thalassotalea agarivorans TaxID=349064 RepID=A0A1I0ES31_THASX|nr:PEP-CTERM sorting domain-containing protein [Thalassotalea agarivorans]SET47379.1 PEP-CTERM protein-sorting domain-containing protein [Thalassotalea agarivorans]
MEIIKRMVKSVMFAIFVVASFSSHADLILGDELCDVSNFVIAGNNADQCLGRFVHDSPPGNDTVLSPGDVNIAYPDAWDADGAFGFNDWVHVGIWEDDAPGSWGNLNFASNDGPGGTFNVLNDLVANGQYLVSLKQAQWVELWLFNDIENANSGAYVTDWSHINIWTRGDEPCTFCEPRTSNRPVPEPSTLLIFALSIISLLLVRKKAN